MDTITSKAVHDSLDTNCCNRADEKNRIYETTHLEQRYSKSTCKDSLVYNLVEQSKKNSFNLLKIKRNQIRNENIEQGKTFETKMLFLDVIANCNFILLTCRL